MKIRLPENFQMPESARPGEPFEVVATITPSETGEFMLTAVDGMELPGEEEEMEDEEEGETEVNAYNDSSKVELPF